MKKDNLDKKIVNHLMKETNEITKLKKPTWENIHHELFSHKERKNNKKMRFITVMALATVFALVWAGFTTTTGQALIQNLKEMFVEEKDIELNIEGQKEETHVELETNEALRYIIYVDTTRYKLLEQENGDKIVLSQELDEKYPEVSMEIVLKEETNAEETVAKIKQKLLDEGMEIRREQKTDTPLKATMISAIGEGYTNEHGKTGTQWDTPVHKYYVTEDSEGQLFVIKQLYFLEAAEGHGVRFDSMLESFEVVR